MKTLLKYFTYSFALAFGLVACDGFNSGMDQNSLDFESQQMAKELQEDLSMSAEQLEALQQIMASFSNESRSPGFIWRIADVLQDTLDDAQKNYLFLQADTAMTMRLVRVLVGPIPGVGNGNGENADANKRPVIFIPPAVVQTLSDDQKTAIKALHESYKPQFETVFANFKEGTSTPVEFVDAVVALKAELRVAIADSLTEEQLALWTEVEQARRDARAEEFGKNEERRAEMIALSKAVRDEVLAIDTETSAAFDALFIAQKDNVRALIQGFRASETTAQEVFEGAFAENDTFYAELSNILADDKIEIVKLHEAIAVRKQNMRRRHGNGGPQGGNGGHNGNGGPSH